MVLRNQYCLSIADIGIEVETDLLHPEEDHFRPFITKEKAPDVRLRFRRVAQLPALSPGVIYEDNCYRVHGDGKGGYVRAFFDAPRDYTPYGVAAWNAAEKTVWVDYLEKGISCIDGMSNSFFHLGLESILPRQGRICIHAACVDTSLGGILFSGPSGIGKSTQAELWCRYRGARQINGDRPILSKTEEGWLAWGSPYAGSSRCHVNACCPVTAIVMLRQSPVCRLRRMGSAEAFRAVWSGLTVPGWDAEAVDRALDLATELATAIPVYEFGCTPDVVAVDYLESGLRKEWNK